MVHVEIRIAVKRDLESLADALGPGTSAAQVRARLEENREGLRSMIVAVREGRAVGSVSIGGGRFLREGSMRLFSLDVGPAFQRKGVGTALINAVEDIAAGRGLNEVNLEVGIDNEEAIRLYRRLGYQRCGEIVMDRWQRLQDDGSSETIETPLFVLVKRLDLTGVR